LFEQFSAALPVSQLSKSFGCKSTGIPSSSWWDKFKNDIFVKEIIFQLSREIIDVRSSDGNGCGSYNAFGNTCGGDIPVIWVHAS
jgi:hypothetical protein